LTSTGVEFPRSACGGRFAVSLRQLPRSQEILEREGCQTPEQETECPPSLFAALLDCVAIEDFQRAWLRLEEQARAAGGRLSPL
jgi:hypothetical protein